VVQDSQKRLSTNVPFLKNAVLSFDAEVAAFNATLAPSAFENL
jgi:hypothetical protein